MWVQEQIPYFTAYIVGIVLWIKKAKITNFASQDLPLCWNAKQDLPAAQVLNYRTCIIHRNLNKHVYISTNSSNRVQVCIYMCWARDGHMRRASFWNWMMKYLQRWEFHGHIWKHGKKNISLRLRKTWQASSYLIWRLLSSPFQFGMSWPEKSTLHVIFPVNHLIWLAGNREAINQMPSTVCILILIRDMTCSNDLKYNYFG